MKLTENRIEHYMNNGACMNIEHYMNDGACWQAQAVLAYVKGNIFRLTDDKYHKTSLNAYVGRYENCREQGYVISIKFFGMKDDKPVSVQRNYAVYQHRNSDTICVLISNTKTIDTPGVDDMWKDKGENPSKYDYDMGFDWDNISGCGDYIITDMTNFLSQYEVK